MLCSAGLQRVFGISRLFAKRTAAGSIALLVAKVTEVFLVVGISGVIKNFVKGLYANTLYCREDH